MKISLVQFKPQFGEIEKNLKYIEQKAQEIDSKIIVFPELCLSGYDFKEKSEVADLSQEPNSELFSEINSIANEHNKIIVFGFAEKSIEEGTEKYYNSALIVSPKPYQNKVYRKTHLFFKERFVFEEGNSGFFIIDYPEFDLKLGTMICYDWRFPEAARSLGLLGADLIVCPSNLVTPVWNVSTPSRALENKVYLAVCNRVGTENRNNEDLVFNGQSVIYKYNSEELAVASRDGEEIITAEIDPKETRKKSFNDYNDIFTDRRPEYYVR